MKIEVFLDRQAVVQARLLEHDADILPRLQGPRDHIDAVDGGAAAVRPQDGAEDVKERRLAGPVGAKEREQLAGREPQS